MTPLLQAVVDRIRSMNEAEFTASMSGMNVLQRAGQGVEEWRDRVIAQIITAASTNPSYFSLIVHQLGVRDPEFESQQKAAVSAQHAAEAAVESAREAAKANSIAADALRETRVVAGSLNAIAGQVTAANRTSFWATIGAIIAGLLSLVSIADIVYRWFFATAKPG